jgi:RNA polymerase sigma-70 factor (ECF subfamily)
MTDSDALLDDLYRIHGKALRNFVRTRVGWEEAEDLVQETYLRLMREGVSLNLDRPRAYLFRVASNLVIDTRRSAKNRSRLVEEATKVACASICSIDPLRPFDSYIEMPALRAFIDGLSPQHRTILLLKAIEGATNREIAERLGVSSRTVERQLVRLKEQFRARFGR